MRKNFAIEILILFFFLKSFQEEPKSGDGLLPKSDAQLINGVLIMFLRFFVRNLVVCDAVRLFNFCYFFFAFR